MRRVVVVSVDAMVFEDTQTLRTLPVFSSLWDRTARVERVRSIYPTITYPCHTTMMTGVYPDRHGVLSNELEKPGESDVSWAFFRESVQVPTIFDLAKASGLTTAAVFWPVTGRDPAIDGLVDEYWPQRPGQTAEECFRESGSSEEVLRRVVAPNLRLVDGRHRQHPYCDDFIFACAGDMLRCFRPHLLMLHPANVDAYRHQSGVFSPLVTHGLHETDHWLGMLLKAAGDAGVLEETDFFIVSDHGQLDIRRAVALNAILAERGLIDVGADGRVRSWRAFVRSGGLSAQVYVRDPARDAAQVGELLCRLRDEGVYGIEQVMTREEARRDWHLDGHFVFNLESDGMTTFAGDCARPLVRPLTNADYRLGAATHGHLPTKGPQPTLIAFGPHIRPGAVIPRADLIDEAPTFARALGLEMTGTDGHALDGLFQD